MDYSLEPLGPGVFAWLTGSPRHGAPNAGVVVAADGLTVVDVLTTPGQAFALRHAIDAVTELPVRRVVLSGSHVAHVGGASVFPLAAVYGSAQTSDHLDQPPNPGVWERLHPEHAGEFGDVAGRPVTHTVAEAAHLCPATIAVPVVGQQFENLVVQVPSVNVVFAGAVASFGVTPLGFEADFVHWIDTLEALKAWGEIIVPGHGTVGGHEEITALQDYLRACIVADGSVERLESGPWDTWTDGRFHEVNVERAARLAAGDNDPPESYRRLLGL